MAAIRLASADAKKFKEEILKAIEYLQSARPTAVNLFWATERMKKTLQVHERQEPKQLAKTLLEEAQRILEEDKDTCRRMAEFGAALIAPGSRVMTHCNAGGLATAGYGTALGVIYRAHEQGKIKEVFAGETRPLLQGARLTCWELKEAGVPVTLVCDTMAGSVLKQKGIDLVLVGADRIAANGDTANKIGTYNLAVLAKHHKIPFYIAAPWSTIDLSISDGSQIPIEERDSKEITHWGGKQWAPEGINVWNPAFDVTPAEFITAFITEKGILKPPFKNEGLP
jgi:methylthioribose-1-phosphate isomerase